MEDRWHFAWHAFSQVPDRHVDSRSEARSTPQTFGWGTPLGEDVVDDGLRHTRVDEKCIVSLLLLFVLLWLLYVWLTLFTWFVNDDGPFLSTDSDTIVLFSLGTDDSCCAVNRLFIFAARFDDVNNLFDDVFLPFDGKPFTGSRGDDTVWDFEFPMIAGTGCSCFKWRGLVKWWGGRTEKESEYKCSSGKTMICHLSVTYTWVGMGKGKMIQMITDSQFSVYFTKVYVFYWCPNGVYSVKSLMWQMMTGKVWGRFRSGSKVKESCLTKHTQCITAPRMECLSRHTQCAGEEDWKHDSGAEVWLMLFSTSSSSTSGFGGSNCISKGCREERGKKKESRAAHKRLFRSLFSFLRKVRERKVLPSNNTKQSVTADAGCLPDCTLTLSLILPVRLDKVQGERRELWVVFETWWSPEHKNVCYVWNEGRGMCSREQQEGG